MARARQKSGLLSGGSLFGSWPRLIVTAVIALAVVGLLAWGGWVLYDYGGLKDAERGLATQQDQADALQDALTELDFERERDSDQLEHARQAAAAATDAAAAGPRWLSVWLSCVHVNRDSQLQSCAQAAHDAPGAGLARAGAPGDGGRATDGAGEDGAGPPGSPPTPEDHRSATEALPGVDE